VLLNPRHENAFADSSDLAFLAMLLDRLRSGMQPSSRALEQAPFVEQWAVIGAGDQPRRDLIEAKARTGTGGKFSA
jgi:hypothetical protein